MNKLLPQIKGYMNKKFGGEGINSRGGESKTPSTSTSTLYFRSIVRKVKLYVMQASAGLFTFFF